MNTWSTCMDMCLMYSQARAPSFTTQAELEDLLRWAKATTIDPVTMELHPTLPSWFYWIAYHRTFRLKFTSDLLHDGYINFGILK